MSKLAALAAVAFLIAGGSAAAQQANERGLMISYSCSGCHGHDFAGQGGMPLLRGRSADELTGMMLEFRSNQRYSTVMGRLVRGLTEEEIRAVSAYLATLR